MLRLADVALAPPARRRRPVASAAIGAEAVAGVPVRDRLGLAEHGERRGGTSPCTAIERRSIECEVVAAGNEQLRRSRKPSLRSARCSTAAVRQQRREHRRASGFDPEQRLDPRAAEASTSAAERTAPRIAAPRGRMGMSRAISTAFGLGPGTKRGDSGGVVATLRDAVERRAAEAERRSAGRGLEKGVVHLHSSLRPALAKRRKAGFNPRESFGSIV